MTGPMRCHGRGLRPALVLTAGLAGLALQFGCATAAADDTPSAGPHPSTSAAARTARYTAVHRAEQSSPRASRSGRAGAAVPAAAAVVRAQSTRRQVRANDVPTDLVPTASLLASNALTDARSRWRSIFGRVPHYDHVVVVMLENHSADEILGVADTNQPPVPYINGVLVSGGALMSASYGLQHPSQPNYYWLFSGSSQGITTDAAPIKVDGTNTVNSTARNLYTELQALRRPKTFAGYVEGYSGVADLSAPNGSFLFDGTIASAGDTTGKLENVVRHIPWAGFANVPQTVTAAFTDFSALGTDFSTLPDVSFVIPALQHDMHDYDFEGAGNVDIPTSDTSMSNGDAWLQENINNYAQWALTHNSLLIITTDEDSTSDWVTPPLAAVNYGGPNGTLAISPGAPGFTSSAQGPSPTDGNASGAAQSGPNTIFTLFYGAHVAPGTYSDPITNVNVLRTVEAAMGIRTKAGAQASFAGTDDSGTKVRGSGFNNRAVKGVFSFWSR